MIINQSTEQENQKSQRTFNQITLSLLHNS
jgi:hypothetical protein